MNDVQSDLDSISPLVSHHTSWPPTFHAYPVLVRALSFDSHHGGFAIIIPPAAHVTCSSCFLARSFCSPVTPSLALHSAKLKHGLTRLK